MWHRCVAGLVLLLLSQWAIADITTWKLRNGLSVWLIPDHRAPLVLTQVWYKVGSADERLGHTGLSHMLEHMLFLGTQKWPKGAYDEAITAMGGSSNAMTTDDATVYYSTVPADKLSEVLMMEADRMRHLVFDETLFQRERKVVMEERRMRMEDRPEALALERYRANAFLSSPYHHMTIGWMHDIANYTLQDAKDWYDKWYWPNHATLIIVGDVDKKVVERQVKRTFGPIQKQVKPSLQKPVATAPRLGAVHQTMHHALVKVPTLTMGVVVPSIGSAKEENEPYALRLLGALLSEGHASLLDQKLRYQTHQVLGIGISYDLFARFDTDFTVHMTPNDKVSPKALMRSVQGIIEDVARKGVSEEALKRAQAQVLAGYVYDQDSWVGRAHAAGRWAILGKSPKAYKNFTARIKKVTSADVQAVAKRYFAPDHWVSVALLPKKEAQ